MLRSLKYIRSPPNSATTAKDEVVFSHLFSRIPFTFMLEFLWDSCFLTGSGFHQWFQHRTILANSWTPGDIVCPRLPFKAIPSSEWVDTAGTGESKQSTIYCEFCTRANTGPTAISVSCGHSYCTFLSATTSESRVRTIGKCYCACSIMQVYLIRTNLVRFYYFDPFHAILF
jgi:hypothetical protein